MAPDVSLLQEGVEVKVVPLLSSGSTLVEEPDDPLLDSLVRV